MRLHVPTLLVGLALGLGNGCGSVSSMNDGGGGGSGADGGAGAGGHAGSGSGGAGGGVSCGDLANRYAAALPAAQRCDLNASAQCQTLVSSSLSPCLNCMTYVNDASTLDPIKASWEQAGCNNVAVLCPAIACVQPTNNTCVAGDAGAGMCSSTSSLPATSGRPAPP